MKELSIEEKAQRYDETIEKLRDFYRDYDTVSRLIDVKEELANLIPELKESEDERIRQFLIQEVTGTSDEIMSYRNMNKEDVLAWLEKQGEKKPAWSDKDKNINQSIIDILTKQGFQTQVNWLKSLKDRVQPKQEWSALDERNLQGVIDEIKANKNNAPDYDLETYDRFLNWLKSLRPHNTWKPSDEQMKALKSSTYCQDKKMSKVLFGLYQDLKKLREE